MPFVFRRIRPSAETKQGELEVGPQLLAASPANARRRRTAGQGKKRRHNGRTANHASSSPSPPQQQPAPKNSSEQGVRKWLSFRRKKEAAANSAEPTEEEKARLATELALSYIKTANRSVTDQDRNTSRFASNKKRAAAAAAASRATVLWALCAVGELVTKISDQLEERFPTIPWSKFNEVRNLMFKPGKLGRKLRYLYSDSVDFIRLHRGHYFLNLYMKLSFELQVMEEVLLEHAGVQSTSNSAVQSINACLTGSWDDFSGTEVVVELLKTKKFKTPASPNNRSGTELMTDKYRILHRSSTLQDVDIDENSFEEYFCFLYNNLRQLPYRTTGIKQFSGKGNRKHALWQLLTAPKLTDSLQFITRAAATLWLIEITELTSHHKFKIHEDCREWRNRLAHLAMTLTHPKAKPTSIRVISKLFKDFAQWKELFRLFDAHGKVEPASCQEDELLISTTEAAVKTGDEQGTSFKDRFTRLKEKAQKRFDELVKNPGNFLEEAAKGNFCKVLKIIKDPNFSSDINELYKGRTLLHYILEYLLKQEDPSSKKNKVDQVTLFNNVNACLQHFRARVDIENSQGKTAVCLFLELPDKTKNQLLRSICQAKSEDKQCMPVSMIIPFLADLEDVNAPLDEKKNTLLHIAAGKDHVELVDYLLFKREKNPADPLIPSLSKEKLPVDLAAIKRKSKITREESVAACHQMLHEETQRRLMLTAANILA